VTDDPLDSLDVPVSPVGGGRRRSYRARAAIVGVGAIVIAWFGLTVLARPAAVAPAAAEASLRPTIAGPSSSAAPSAPPGGAPTSGPSRSSGQDLPVIADAKLPGAPFPVFVVRDGQDADLMIWQPGSPAVGPLARFPGAFGGTFSAPPTDSSSPPDGGAIAWLSPDRSSLLVSQVRSAYAEGADTARLATYDGIVWERAGITALGGLAWSPDGNRIALSERHDRWLLAERGGNWTARSIDLSAAGHGPAPSATSGSRFPLDNQTVPAGFSQSGAWVIGARIGPRASRWTPAVRVRVADGRAEPLASFPIGGPDGLATTPSLIVDPASGRVVGYGPNGNIPGGPPQLEVHEPNGSYAFGARSGIVISWLWTGDGRLIVLGADGYPFPSRWALQLIESDGSARTLIEAPRASGGALFGIRDGYAGLVLTGSDPARRQIVVVRLDDGAASAITVDAFGSDGPIGAGWLP
jgi:hypothetical protein